MTDPTNASEKPGARKKALSRLAVVGGGVIGIAGARLLGAPFWLPVAAITIVWPLLQKWKVPPRFVPVLAITIGHTIWIAGGMLLLAAMSRTTIEDAIYQAVEVVIVAALVWWVLKKKSVAALVALIVYDGIGFLFALLNLDQKGALFVTIVMHLILRTAGIAAAVYAIVQTRRTSPH